MASTPKGAPPRGWNPKPIANLPGKDTSGKVNLKVADFDKLIDVQGVRVKVYRTAYCPNVKSIDGAEHELKCKICHGAGFIDRYCIETWAFIQNQDLEKSVQVEGIIDGNSVLATFKQGIELQYFTLVELQDFTEQFFERIKRQRGKIDVLKYKGVRVNMLIDKNGKEYYEGQDYVLDPNGSIAWCDNKGPDKGVIYTINYETAVRFRAIRSMHSNRFAQIGEAGITKLIKMNEQWLLQKDYLVERKDAQGNPIAPNKIRDEDDQEELEELEAEEY